MAYYSHSKLSTFEQCPQKYKFRYIDKIKPIIEKTIEAHLGSATHAALEWLYNFVKDNPNEKPPALDEVLEKYIEEWQKDFSENIAIVKKQFTAGDYFNKGITFLANYYPKCYPFKDGTIECEKRIVINLDGQTKIQGFIDRLVRNIDKGIYEIHDYKTANTLPTQEKMDHDRQLALYSIAIKEMYGKDKEVVLIWHYLAHNQKIVSRRTEEQLEQLKQETIDLIKKIESTTNFYVNPSILCDWCEFKDICPAFNARAPDNSRIHKQTTLNDHNKPTQQGKEELNKFPTAKKYIVDKQETNPADKEGFELGIF